MCTAGRVNPLSHISTPLRRPRPGPLSLCGTVASQIQKSMFKPQKKNSGRSDTKSQSSRETSTGECFNLMFTCSHRHSAWRSLCDVTLACCTWMAKWLMVRNNIVSAHCAQLLACRSNATTLVGENQNLTDKLYTVRTASFLLSDPNAPIPTTEHHPPICNTHTARAHTHIHPLGGIRGFLQAEKDALEVIAFFKKQRAEKEKEAREIREEMRQFKRDYAEEKAAAESATERVSLVSLALFTRCTHMRAAHGVNPSGVFLWLPLEWHVFLRALVV